MGDAHAALRAETGRYTWPVLWAAARTEAEGALAATGREQDPDASGRVDWLRDNARELALASPASAAHAALVAGELARFERHGERGAWELAVEACRRAEEPFLVSYALTQLADARLSERDRDGAQRAAGEALAMVREHGMELLERAAVTRPAIGGRPISD